MGKGLCKFCIQPRILGHKQLCEKHYVTNAVQWAIGRCDNQVTKIFLERFYANPICPYTGQTLILGINAHLDHIESRKNRPDLAKELTNLEWVSEQANLAKNGMSNNEFIQFCSLIASLNHSP